MMALCEKADNDIRTCLNTLQFIHRKSSDLTLSAVQAVALGQKDSHKSVLTFLREVFKLPTPKQFTHNRSELEAKENITSLRYYYMLMESSRTGEYDKVLQGLFENYLSVKIRDPNMEIVAEVQDWILFQESLSTIIYSSQEYQFMSYLPFTSVIFHFFYAVTSGQRTIQYPRTQYEITQKHQRSKQLVSQIASESQPSVLRDIDRQMSSVYFVPLLLNIITPNLRPVNVQLYTKWEKGLLKMIVSTMVAYNLTYKQDRGPDGQYTYLLDPELDELCGYTGLPQKRQLQYVTKQLLAREIGQAKVKHEAKSDSSLAIKERINPKSLPAVNVSKSRNKRQRNFFGQPLVNKEPPLTSETNNPSVKAVWFKFNEGFSDAVKKPIKIQDLL
jgi:chromosome transmission fidelity protein 18